MKLHVSKAKLPKNPLSRAQEKSLLLTLKQKLADINPNRGLFENLNILNNAVADSFYIYGIGVQYAGVYGIRAEEPLTTGPIGPNYGGNGCPRIELWKGVIAYVVRNRESYLVPSTNTLENENKDEHCDCRTEGETPQFKSDVEKPDLTEIVLAKKSKIILPNGTETIIAPVVYDIDLEKANQFSPRGALGLEDLVVPVLDMLFPDVKYPLTPWAHYLPKDSCSPSQ